MKKLLILILIALPLTASAVWYNPLTWFEKSSPELSVGGPSVGTVQYVPTLLPLNDNQWDLGTSTKVFRNIFMYNSAGTTRCLQITSAGLIQIANAACGSGGGGGGSGTFSTTTLGGQIIQYPYTPLITSLDSDSTTTSAVYFDPINQKYQIGNTNTASTTLMGNVYFPTKSQGFAYLGSNSQLNSLASSSILLQDLGGAVTDAQVPNTITVDLAGTATALAGNGTNATAGNAILGVDASGNAEGAFDVWTEAENTSAAYTPQARTLTVAGTANQITSSAGAQDLSANRTWTLSFPNSVIFPQSISTTYSSTTGQASFINASSTQWESGGLQACNATTGKLNWDATTKQFKCDTDQNTGGSGGADFTYATDIGFGVTGSATTTKTQFTLGIHASSTSQFDNATSTLLTAVTGWFTNIFVGADTLAEYISDTAGAFFTGNTETGITVTYQDADNTVDVVCNTADTSTFGCLTDTDWDTFNNKAGLAANTFTGLQTFPYSSSTIYSSFLTASSTFQNIGTLTFGGVTGSAWTDFCTSITGSADLCDGVDSSGTGSSKWATTTNTVGVYPSGGAGTKVVIGGIATTTSQNQELEVIGNQVISFDASSYGSTPSLSLVGLTTLGQSYNSAAFVRYANGDSTGPTLIGYRAAGSAASPTAVDIDDELLELTGRGYDGTDWSAASQGAVRINASEIWDTSGHGTYITFGTTPNNATTEVERLRVGNNGLIGIGTSTPFSLLQLSSTTASATFKPQLALSDFSAGTNLKHWTLSSQGGNFYIASSTDLYATSTDAALSINGSTRAVTFGNSLATCTALTGSADLCDGSDASGAGGSSAYEMASTSDIAVSQVAYISKTGGRTTLASVATSTLAVGSSLSSSGTLGYQIGGTNSSLSINTANANTWTAKQDFFGSASSTLFSSNWLKVGGTASTTIDGAGNVALPAAGTLTIPALTSALTLTGAGGELAEYAGTSCTNQFVRSLSALGVATCATVGSADVSLANLTATNSTLTFSGTYTGATARTIGLNLGNANTWTAKQNFFGAASSTLFSSNWLKVGGTASTTLDGAGNVTYAGLLSGPYSSSTIYSSFLTASSTFANVGTLSMPSLANSFPYFNSSGTAVATTSPVFYERMFSNWASTTPNFNSQIYASGATSTLKIYLPRAVSFTAIGGSVRTGTSLLCEIGNGTASSTRVLTTTAGQTSDSVTLAGEVTVACGSGSGNPDDANFTVLGTYSI